MALSTRVWSAGRWLLLGGALFGTYVLFAAASMRVALRAREVQVPDLTTRTANEAAARATDLGLAIRVDELRRTDLKVGAGRVVAQDPPAGATTRRRRTVKVWLSAGQRNSTVPSLVGENERTAQARLTQEGLALASISEIRSDSYGPDAIVAQDPQAKAEGSRVSLLVNRGERGAHYVMPDLIGVGGERAAEILRAHGFRVAIVASVPYQGLSLIHI